MQTSKIRGFRGQYQFLSNFYACDIKVGELTFTSVEAAFQAAKCANAEDRAQFQGLTAADAKTLGRRVTLRADWEQVKLTILAKLVKMKFTGNPAACCQGFFDILQKNRAYARRDTDIGVQI